MEPTADDDILSFGPEQTRFLRPSPCGVVLHNLSYAHRLMPLFPAKTHARQPALTRSARHPILPPSPNQVADACFHDRSPNIQSLNTAGTIGVVSETDTFDTWFGRAIRPVFDGTIGGNGSPIRADNRHRPL
jgi:hypothetical protein